MKFESNHSNKCLVLGTALWGWAISKFEAFALLDKYIDSGNCLVDTATNYPINRIEEDYGLAISWISEWKRIHKNTKLELIVKIGASDNSGGDKINLSYDYIISQFNYLSNIFNESLTCLSVHWDNRGDTDIDQMNIAKTVDALTKIRQTGCNIGLSGIKYPECYLKANSELLEDWIIQVKENILTNSSRLRYQKYLPFAKYLAYGINFGGLKSGENYQSGSLKLRGIKINDETSDSLRSLLDSDFFAYPKPLTISDLSLLYAYYNPNLHGVIIGPSNVDQLVDILFYWNKLVNNAVQTNDTLYNTLQKRGLLIARGA